MLQKFIQTFKPIVDAVPHWVLLVFAAGVGAVLSYFQAEPNAAILSAFTSWTVAVPILKGAVIAFVGTVIALLKTAPWVDSKGSSSGGGPVSLDPREMVTVPPSAPKGPTTQRRSLVWVPLVAISLVALPLVTVSCNLLTPAVVVPTAELLEKVVEDALKGMSVVDIVKDTGLTLLTVLEQLLGSKDSRVHSSTAFVEAMKTKAGLMPVGCVQ